MILSPQETNSRINPESTHRHHKHQRKTFGGSILPCYSHILSAFFPSPLGKGPCVHSYGHQQLKTAAFPGLFNILFSYLTMVMMRIANIKYYYHQVYWLLTMCQALCQQLLSYWVLPRTPMRLGLFFFILIYRWENWDSGQCKCQDWTWILVSTNFNHKVREPLLTSNFNV